MGCGSRAGPAAQAVKGAWALSSWRSRLGRGCSPKTTRASPDGALREFYDRGPMAATVKCPWCAEEILAEARKCKHCGEFFVDKEAGRRL